MNLKVMIEEASKNCRLMDRPKFIQSQSYSFMYQAFTQDDIDAKIDLIKTRMMEPRDFYEICDDKDIFLGKNAQRYATMVLNGSKLSYKTFIHALIELESIEFNA
jgi:hypothetical protein